MNGFPGTALRIMAVTAAVAGLTFGWPGASGQAAAGGGDAPLVRVTASGSVAAEPDLAVVTVGTRTEAAEASRAMDENSRRMSALIEALREAGIAERDIQTHELRLMPRYEQADGRRRPSGYEAVNTVRVRVRDLARLGGVLDIAVKSGGNIVENLSFTFDDPAALRDRARAEAVQEARRKAAALVALAGADLGPLHSISEVGGLPGPEPRMAVMSLEAAEVPVQPGTLSVTVIVQAEWLIRAKSE